MAIRNLGGMIMDVAPDKVESIAIWMSSGFNTRNYIWWSELPRRNIKVKLVYPIGEYTPGHLNSEHPWRNEFDTIWEIIPDGYKKLKYIYIFSNPSDSQSVIGINEIDRLIKQCLVSLAQFKVKTVAMILIPSTNNGGHGTNEDDEISARHMISAIKNWIIEYKSDLDVYLVDRVDGFAPLIINE